MAFAFAGTLSLNRSFALEKESGAGRALALAPVDPAGIFLGKCLANTVFLLATQVIALPLFVIFFDVSVARAGALTASFALGSLAFAASVSTLPTPSRLPLLFPSPAGRGQGEGEGNRPRLSTLALTPTLSRWERE